MEDGASEEVPIRLDQSPAERLPGRTAHGDDGATEDLAEVGVVRVGGAARASGLRGPYGRVSSVNGCARSPLERLARFVTHRRDEQSGADCGEPAGVWKSSPAEAWNPQMRGHAQKQ